MPAPSEGRPDVLVLGGGGILGEAWMSAVLAGLGEAAGWDARGCRGFVGTSAGSIVATALAAGISPHERLGELAAEGAGDQPPATAADGPRATFEQALGQAAGAVAGVGGAVAAPFVALALGSARPGRALLSRTLLRAVPPGSRSLGQLGPMVERSGARWDGRLLVATVRLDSGRRVMFGADGAPASTVAAAVCASCAIPGVFEPVRIAGRHYVDGGAWSPTNMDAAEVRRGDQVLCLNPTGSMRASMGPIAGALGPMSRGLASSEALALRNRGASVTIVNPDAGAMRAMGVNLMDPRPRAAVIAAGLAQGRGLAAPLRRAA
jgi:NTE family protein